MKNNNERKVLKVGFDVWCDVVTEFAKEFNKEYYEIEEALLNILKDEGVEDITVIDRTKDAVIEIINAPLNEMCTMYNIYAFRREYKNKLENYEII